MILKDLVEKLLDYDLDLPVVKHNGDCTASEVVDAIACSDEKGQEVIAIKFG